MIADTLYFRSRPFSYAMDLMGLCKPQIAFASVLSSMCGYLLAARPAGIALATLATGVWLIAAGAGALNHYQERDIDALMIRTARRPLPSGMIRPASALKLSAVLIFSGILVLLLTGMPLVGLMGLVAVIWYNGLYTNLKARSSLAVLPGAIVGAIPPVMGWLAGGGHLPDGRLGALCFLILMWQIPHVLLHLLVNRTDYEQSGFPSLLALFSGAQLRRLAFLWLIATAVSAQVIIGFGLLHTAGAMALLIVSSLVLIIRGIMFISSPQNDAAPLFRQTNYYMLLILLIIALDGWQYLMGASL
jgi:heme o synthase